VSDWHCTEGRAWPLGASVVKGGVNFAVFSAHAEAIELCLFAGGKEQRLPFSHRTGDVWHMQVQGLAAGAEYGFRASGPYRPGYGHRFNPAKLLLDPYARALSRRLTWAPEMTGHGPDGGPDRRDSAAVLPRAQVVTGAFDWEGVEPPQTAPENTVIYEAHVKALTQRHPAVPKALRGSYAALGHPAVIAHLTALGVTALELLPIQAFIDDRFVTERGLVNHWGYNTIGFFAPEPRYGTLDALKGAVKALHRAGIEVFLDVVYNHSGEGEGGGATIAFRGLDNASYYRMSGGHDLNDAGTGNTLNLCQPAVLRMVMDSLRYWVEEVHIDGFRFDLATVLGRAGHGFDPAAPFFAALRQDPVLARVKLIAEPWDIGPGGYRLGEYPPPFAEWNDRFRDGVRRFWKGEPGMAPELARRLLGSAERFDHGRRAATASVNYITAHDGFTLQDVVSYNEKHNEANRESNRDGHGDNHSDNMGVEGPTTDPAIRAARALRKRNLMATLMLAQGLPMILAGDELGHSQGGNNNAYAQDNATTWLDWQGGDIGFQAFTARLTALRRAHPVLRQKLFLHSRLRADGQPDVIWRKADGQVPTAEDWHAADFRCVGLELRMAAEGPDAKDALYLVFNAGPAGRLTLPDTARQWRCLLDSTRPEAAAHRVKPTLDLPAQSVFVFEPVTLIREARP
jgi:isoamylase